MKVVSNLDFVATWKAMLVFYMVTLATMCEFNRVLRSFFSLFQYVISHVLIISIMSIVRDICELVAWKPYQLIECKGGIYSV